MAFAPALGLDRSAMQLDQVFDESKAEAEAAVPSGARRVGLSEAVKDIRQEITADAFARVAHGDANVRVYALQERFDAASLRRELDRVGEQVPDHLLQARWVAGNLANFGGEISLERDPFGVSRRVDRLNRLLNYRDQVHWPDLQPEFAADDAGRVEQVINQLRLGLPAALDDFRRMFNFLGVQPAVTQQGRVSENRVQRRTQFMRHEREEFILHPVCLLGLAPRLLLYFVKARVLDGERDTVGRQLQQPHVVFSKAPGPGRLSVNHADEPSFDDQRSADQRTGVSSQNRVDHLHRRDVFHNERSAARRNGAGHALSYRHMHPRRGFIPSDRAVYG